MATEKKEEVEKEKVKRPEKPIFYKVKATFTEDMLGSSLLPLKSIRSTSVRS